MAGGTAIEVEGDDEVEEDKEQPRDKDKNKGKDKAKNEAKQKGKDKGQRKDKDKDKAQTTWGSQPSQSADEVVQRCKDSLTQQMSLTRRDCISSALAKAMFDASKSKAQTLIGRLTKQLETERTGRANAQAQFDKEQKRVRQLDLENESMKKQLLESNTKSAEAKQHAEQLLAGMWGAPLEGVRRTPPPFWVPLEPQCACVYNV